MQKQINIKINEQPITFFCAKKQNLLLLLLVK